MRSLAVAPVLALLLSGCAARDPYAGEPDQAISDQWTLEPGSFYAPTFDVGRGGAHVRANVTVLSGGPIDVFLASGRACMDPSGDAFAPAARLLSTAEGALEAALPEGRACLVLDNHDAPTGTAPGNATATVAYAIRLWEE